MKDSAKIGEATFSEVFKFELANGEREVVKIIPLELEVSSNSVDVYPLPININAAIHECTVLNEVSSLKEHRKESTPPSWTGFNRNIEMRVLKGQYPKQLNDAWIKWDKEKTSKNSNPGTNIMFIICLINGFRTIWRRSTLLSDNNGRWWNRFREIQI